MTEPSKISQVLLGKPRDVKDPNVFHRLSLVAFLAWVGLGADGLSSSAYGPEEAFRALGSTRILALVLVAMTARHGRGDLASRTRTSSSTSPAAAAATSSRRSCSGAKVGVVSGCALLVDYVLTITVSIASALRPALELPAAGLAPYKLPVEFAVLVLLIVLNLRGVKESVTVLAPIFLVFIVTHAFAILYVLRDPSRAACPSVFHGAARGLPQPSQRARLWPLVFILLRAYSLGGGTYTGIEAVSNGVAMLREPRVQTGKRTMILMAISLAFTAGGILFGYLLSARARGGQDDERRPLRRALRALAGRRHGRRDRPSS